MLHDLIYRKIKKLVLEKNAYHGWKEDAKPGLWGVNQALFGVLGPDSLLWKFIILFTYDLFHLPIVYDTYIRKISEIFVYIYEKNSHSSV